MEEYETVLLVKNEVFVFQIPPRATNRGYRAADWKLDAPAWTGRMRIVSKGKLCFIKLEDKTSGELFAKAPIDKYPGIAVESVTDSSRYFVLRIEDDNGRAAFIGIGFSDRGDSFDLNVTLQEHFKWIQNSEEIEKDLADPDSKSNLDLGFKEGQTIKINMNIGKKSNSSKPRPKIGASSGVPGLLPPPPGGIKLPPPSSSNKSAASSTPQVVNASATCQSTPQPPAPTTTNSKDDFLLEFDSLNIGSNSTPSQPSTASVSANALGTDLWGDFATASGTTTQQAGSTTNNWIDF